MTMSSFDKQLVVTGIVFAVFMVAESKSERTTFMDAFKTLPDGNELLTMAAVVMAASIISGFLISEAEKKMGAKSAL